MQTCSLAEKYALSIILAAGVLKSRTLDIFSDGLWGWLSKLLSVTSKPKENTFKKYSFLLRNNNFQIVLECFADLEFTKIFIVSTLISMRSFGELLACLLARASGFMITNSFNI